MNEKTKPFYMKGVDSPFEVNEDATPESIAGWADHLMFEGSHVALCAVEISELFGILRKARDAVNDAETDAEKEVAGKLATITLPMMLTRMEERIGALEVYAGEFLKAQVAASLSIHGTFLGGPILAPLVKANRETSDKLYFNSTNHHINPDYRESFCDVIRGEMKKNGSSPESETERYDDLMDTLLNSNADRFSSEMRMPSEGVGEVQTDETVEERAATATENQKLIDIQDYLHGKNHGGTTH